MNDTTPDEMTAAYNELGAAIDQFEQALRAVSRGTPFQVEIADFTVVFAKRKGAWRFFVEGSETVLVRDCAIGTRLTIAEHADVIMATAQDAASSRYDRIMEAIANLDSVTAEAGVEVEPRP